MKNAPTLPAATRDRVPGRPAYGALALAASLALAAGLSGCATQGPNAAPAAPGSPKFLETPPGWMTAAPADTLARGPWWTLFDDPVLNQLVPQVAVSNQTVAADAAAVAESWATVRAQRASLFPTVSLTSSATRSGSGRTSASSSTNSTTTGNSASNEFALGLGASWEPDLWGRIGLTVSAAKATAQATEGDLAAALLSAQAAFVTDYLSVREADAEIAVVQETVKNYQRALTITQNRYAAAIAVKSDVMQAQTTLANAQADLSALVQQRKQFQHAMAVLAGQPPAGFMLPPGEWKSNAVPAAPIGVPSELLQRRPDIAAAERRAAAANADIGVAHAAFFPAITLSGSAGQDASRLGNLFNASSFAWSLGASLAQTIFDGGAHTAAVDAARAAWDQAVANYRQTVLTAFGDVEDQISSAGALEEQEGLRRTASVAADETEKEMMNRYQQGINAYTDVITAQVAALTARRTLLQVTLSRQTGAVTLISDLGGGWDERRLSADGPSH